jgi:hypothetical protein
MPGNGAQTTVLQYSSVQPRAPVDSGDAGAASACVAPNASATAVAPANASPAIPLFVFIVALPEVVSTRRPRTRPACMRSTFADSRRWAHLHGPKRTHAECRPGKIDEQRGVLSEPHGGVHQ